MGNTTISFIWNNVAEMGPVVWWKGLCKSKLLSRVAVIILTASCTSAASERSFSTHAHIHSHKGNRLTTDRVARVAYITYTCNLLHKHKDEDNDEDDEPLSSPNQLLSSQKTSSIHEEQSSTSGGNQKEMEFCDVLPRDCDNESEDND